MKTPLQFITEKYGLDSDSTLDLDAGQWLICMREYAEYCLNFIR